MENHKIINAFHIDTLGKSLSPNQCFDYVSGFCSGYARVKLNSKWNFIDTQAKLVSPNQWFDYVCDLFNGYAVVELNDKWNFIDTKGNITS